MWVGLRASSYDSVLMQESVKIVNLGIWLFIY